MTAFTCYLLLGKYSKIGLVRTTSSGRSLLLFLLNSFLLLRHGNVQAILWLGGNSSRFGLGTPFGPKAASIDETAYSHRWRKGCNYASFMYTCDLYSNSNMDYSGDYLPALIRIPSECTISVSSTSFKLSLYHLIKRAYDDLYILH